MKKNFITVAKSLIMGLAVTTSVTMVSCSDDLAEIPQSTEMNSNLLDSNSPFGCGYNSLSVSCAELLETTIPLNTADVVLTNTNRYFSYMINNVGGQYVIRIAYNGNPGNFESDILTITSKDGKTTKNIFVSLTGETLMTRACSIEDNSPMACVLNSMAHGFIPGKVAEDAKAAGVLFSAETIKNLNDKNKGDDLITINTNNRKSNYFFDKATSHNEVIKKTSLSTGLNLAIPVKGWNLGLDASYKRDKSESHVEDRETAMYGWKARAASGHLNKALLGTRLDNTYKNNKDKLESLVEDYAKAIVAVSGESDIESVKNDVRMALAMQSIMTTSAVNLLNNPNSSAYKMYDNSDEKIRELIKTYGMYVSTDCQMGGMAQTTLTKKSDASNISLEQAMQVALSASSQTSTSTNSKSEAKTESKEEGNSVVTKIIKTTPSTASVKATMGLNLSEQQIKEAMEIHTETKAWGGNMVQDINKWNLEYDKTNTWVCISFATPNDDTDFGEIKDQEAEEASIAALNNGSIIPIWKLALDPNRREALRKMIEPDSDNKINYFYYTSSRNRTLVIADVKYKFYNKGTNDSDIKSFYDYDSRPEGKKMHLYIPMRQNSTTLGTQDGYINLGHKEISTDKGHEKNVSHMMVPFVAYEYVYDDDVKENKDYTGIRYIRMGDGAQNGETVASGWTFEIMNGTWEVDPKGSQYLVVAYAQKSTPLSQRVRGVGFCFSNDNTNGNLKGKIFASSIGADLEPNNYDMTRDDFNKHWSNGNMKVHGNCLPNVIDTKTGFLGSDINTRKKVQPCYTFVPVTRSNIDQSLKKAADASKR